MSVVMLGLRNYSGQPITIGQPVSIVGHELMSPQPDPVPAGGIAAGMVESPTGSAELEVRYIAQVAANPTVSLTIDIWIRGTTFEKFIVTSSNPGQYPIEGVYSTDGGPDAFAAVVTVG